LSSRPKIFVIAATAMFALIATAACSNDTPSPFSTTTPVPAADTSATDETGGNSGDSSASSTGSGVTGPDIANGKSKYSSLGCSGCHSTGTNKLVGPGLAGIGAKSDDFIRESIVDPGAVIVDGFADIMPKSFKNLKESDIADLVAYLKTLN